MALFSAAIRKDSVSFLRFPSVAIIIISLIIEFFTLVLMMIFHWSLSDSKSPQISGILFSILADFNYAVVWMVSTCPLISKTFHPCTNPLVIVPNAPITIGITVTLMFHSFLLFFFFFQFCSKDQVFISLFAYLQFYPVVSRNGQVHYSVGSLIYFFYFIFFYFILF